jgi:CheY-like chemotaxis protein
MVSGVTGTGLLEKEGGTMNKIVEILMVEDNRGDIVLLEEAMRKAGLSHRIKTVKDGVQAMEYLRRQGEFTGVSRPDLIVLDLKLPRKNGREVLEEIRRDPELCSIRLVVLSSSKSELDLAMADKELAPKCMVKPNTFKKYIELVNEIETFRNMGQKAAE